MMVAEVKREDGVYKVSIYGDKNKTDSILNGNYRLEIVIPNIFYYLFPRLLERKLLKTVKKLKRDLVKQERDRQWLRELNQRLNASLEEM